MKRSLTPGAPQGLYNRSFRGDIQFSSAMNSPTVQSTFQQHRQLLAPSVMVPPPFEGPFQVIEPGSEFYMDIPDYEYCVDPFGGIGIMEQQELFISDNGIPQEVLDDVFRLDDDIVSAGGVLPKQYPVPDGLSMKEYGDHLVAEMEQLFPEVKPSFLPAMSAQTSRLREELVKASAPENPCYMSVQLKTEGAKKGRKIATAPRDANRGFRCVEMIDGSGIAFKAKFYDHMTKKQFTPVPPVDISVQQRRVAELLQSPGLRTVSPEMASKIETLASGKRDVTLAKVRPPDAKNSTTTIVIKTPKRTIASSGTMADPPVPPPPPPLDFPVPMKAIKQEPSSSSFEVTPIELPVIMPTPVNNKQPRKQRLHSLSQCDVVFKDGTNTVVTVARPPPPPSGNRACPAPKPAVPRGRGLPANDFVTVTITDAPSTAKKDQSQPSRPPTPRGSTTTTKWTAISIPSPTKVQRPLNQPYSFRKRSLITHYRIQMTPNHNRVSGQSVESIEIVDTTDEETDSSGSPPAPAAKAAPSVKPVPKLPGNTESIQCPFCCKVFFSSHALMIHGNTCADAVLFGKRPPKEQLSSSKPATKSGASLLKSSVEKAKSAPPPASNAEPSRPQPQPEKQPAPSGKKNRPSRGNSGTPQSRTTRRLSIEILPTAFNIDNLLLCDVCKKTFRSQDHLEVHQNIHKAPIVCQFCKKKFHKPPPKHTCQEMKRAKQQK